ncbi:MAG: septum formation initiator family protein [Patescibacteria group bacterium]
MSYIISQNKLWSIFQKIGIALLFLFLIVSLIRGVSSLASARRQIREAEKKVEEAKKKNEELKAKAQEVTSEVFTEQVARDKLGLAKPGETIIVLPESEIVKKFSGRIVNEEQDTLPDPNWKRWLKLFL